MERYEKLEVFVNQIQTEITPRIQELIRSKFFIEAFLLHSALIESILKLCIEEQECQINTNLSDNELLKLENDNLKKVQIGILVKKFKHFYGKDDGLEKRIENFSKSRNSFTHHLFERSMEQNNDAAMSEIETSLNTLMELLDYYKELLNLSRKS